MSDMHPTPHAALAHGHAGHAHGGPGHSDHHWSHAVSPKLLLGTFAVLILLTFLTVTATSVNLGWTFNLVVAMVIATIKALLVALFFMHLAFDKGFNGMIFMGSVVFASVFVLIALMDTGSYQDLIDPTLLGGGQ